ncbi:hypothetical protein HETIRDRAFT_411111 [Heterobasidion irregulare TC 32-1]|uniref:Uncharacterized protein n=1 Tax=Heterobasidion irregulare (strain TC 32-1) TaxID=747525 RepID=W4JXJ4_HETIT|nr:uncharacterized protein HETIRDRAFT_411111 [Heterobasidion irregulare TC 32-1]ETW77780.1 hypothetical protein HETIRDRAFT_411111 [Heterobasidion irregulare TC 32-1]
MADDESVGGVQGGDCDYGVYQHSGSQRKMSKTERTKVKVGMYGSHRDCRVVMLIKALKDLKQIPDKRSINLARADPGHDVKTEYGLKGS